MAPTAGTTCPPKQMVPPRVSRSAAAAMACARFAGPSGSVESAGRWAPVSTTGLSPKKRSKARAVSSIESVPWVTTTPVVSGLASSRAMVATRPSRSAKVSDDESSRDVSTGEQSIPASGKRLPAASRARSTRSAALSVGTSAPPAVASAVQAMVPPVAITAMRGWGKEVSVAMSAG